MDGDGSTVGVDDSGGQARALPATRTCAAESTKATTGAESARLNVRFLNTTGRPLMAVPTTPFAFTPRRAWSAVVTSFGTPQMR